MQIYWMILGTLCTWRLTHLLNAEDGPGDIFVCLRRLAGSGFFGKLLDCFYCLSVWVAAPCAALIAQNWKEGLFLWLAFSGAACLLERATDRRLTVPPVTYFEDKEDPDVVLRQSERTNQHRQPGPDDQQPG